MNRQLYYRQGLNHLKRKVVTEATGHDVDPEDAKYAMARLQGIDLKRGYNGDLKSRDAGAVGGPIGGQMVRELIRIAEERLARENRLR